MVKIGKAELKRALIAAEAKRAQPTTVFRPDAARNPKLKRSERDGEKLFTDFFRKSGFDAKAYRALQKQRGAELQRIVDKDHAAAVKRAAGLKNSIHANLSRESAALARLASQRGFFPFPSYSLEKPFLIWATPHSNIISDSNIEPFNSWAKIRVDTGASSGLEKLAFYFLWDNPTDFYAVINANTFMSATGHLKATAYGGLSGIDPTSRTSFVGVGANFALWSWWQQPPSMTPYDQHPFASLWPGASFWDKTQTASINDAASMGKSMFLIPPRGAVVFEAMFHVTYANSHGHVVADFESGNFRIACPVVVVTVLTAPPVAGMGGMGGLPASPV